MDAKEVNMYCMRCSGFSISISRLINIFLLVLSRRLGVKPCTALFICECSFPQLCKINSVIKYR